MKKLIDTLLRCGCYVYHDSDTVYSLTDFLFGNEIEELLRVAKEEGFYLDEVKVKGVFIRMKFVRVPKKAMEVGIT